MILLSSIVLPSPSGHIVLCTSLDSSPRCQSQLAQCGRMTLAISIQNCYIDSGHSDASMLIPVAHPTQWRLCSLLQTLGLFSYSTQGSLSQRCGPAGATLARSSEERLFHVLLLIRLLAIFVFSLDNTHGLSLRNGASNTVSTGQNRCCFPLFKPDLVLKVI